MIFDLDPKGQQEIAEQAALNPLRPEQVRPSAFTGVATGAGEGIMKGGARVSQFLGLAGATVPMTLDRFFPEDASGASRTERYFKNLEEIVNRAADYWTPDASQVGSVGRLLGGVGEVVLPFLSGGGNPLATASMVAGSQTAGTGVDMAKQGLPSGYAGFIAGVQGATAAAGAVIPFFGSTLASRMASGAIGNLAPNMAGAAVQSRAANMAGSPQVAQQFNPFDLEARAVDVLAGLVFGGVAHMAARSRRRPLNQDEIDATLTALNASHYQQAAAIGTPADPVSAATHTRAMDTAIEQLMRGERVNVADAITLSDFVRKPRPELEQAVTDALAPPPELTARALPPVSGLPQMAVETRKALRFNAVELDTYAREVEARNGLPAGLLVAIKNAGERSNSNQVSPAGARGVMQFIPATYRQFGKGDPTDPVNSIDAAGAYFADLLKRYNGNVDAAITEYNGGVRQAQRVAAGGKPTVKETADYLPRVKAYMEQNAVSRETVQIADYSPKPSLRNTEYRELFAQMSQETGWAETGGRLIRDATTGDVTGRTSWIPRAEWWPDRPKDLTEAQANAAIAKAMNNEPLRVPEQRLVDYMLSYAQERLVKPYADIPIVERAELVNELRAADLGDNMRNVVDVDAVARASQINADAVERAAIAHEADDIAFMRAIRGILDEHNKKQRAGSGQGATGGSESSQPATPRQAEPSATATKTADNPLTTKPQKPADSPLKTEAPPELQAAREAVDSLPDARIKLDDGTEVNMREYARTVLSDVQAEYAQASADSRAFLAAANCFLRTRT